MIKTTLEKIIHHITPKSTGNTEYLGYFGGKQYYFRPTDFAKQLFTERIGDKWSNTGVNSDIQLYTKADLLRTNMVFSGKYLVAIGGLCPSGVRLAEVTDIDNLESIVMGVYNGL